MHAWPNERPVTDFVRHNQSDRVFDLEVGPDGTVWLARNGRPGPGEISSFDGASWSVHRQLAPDQGGAPEIVGVEVLPTGDVWGAWARELDDGFHYAHVTVARLGEAGWEPLPEVAGDDADLSVAAAGGGGVWLMPGAGRGLTRHDGDGWAVQAVPGYEVRRADAGPEGTLWARLERGECSVEPGGGGCSSPGGGRDGLARFDGRDREVFEAPDGIPVSGDKELAFKGFFEAAPDGSLWWDPRVEEFVDTMCDGVANFDGQALRRYLRGMCIYAMDVAPDGAVWLQGRLPKADDAQPIDTYVITPEAVVVAE